MEASECEEMPAGAFPIGVCMGVFGSIGINIGQNLQASGLQALPEEKRHKPHLSKLWRLGLLIFVSFSMLNFGAFALAPAMVLTPLESIQFVTNVLWNKFVNRKAVSRRMIVGVMLALTGTVFSVLFGAQPRGCNSVDRLRDNWTSPTWWVYLIATVALAAIATAFHIIGTRRRRQGKLSTRYAALMPIAYTISSALAGGAQMIVHSKVISEMLSMLFRGQARNLPTPPCFHGLLSHAPSSMLFRGQVSILTSWLFYVELVLVITCGIVWAWRLTACLILYDPLIILPLMVGTVRPPLSIPRFSGLSPFF